MYYHQKISLFPVPHLLIIHPSWQGWRSPTNSDFNGFFMWFKIAKDEKKNPDSLYSEFVGPFWSSSELALQT